MDKKTKIILAVFAVIIAIIIFYGVKETPSPASEVRYPAPSFVLKTYDGKRVSTESLKGKPTVLIFSGTWCPVCVKEAPKLNSVYRQYNGEVNFLGIALNDTPERVKAFAKERGVTFPIAIGNEKVSADYSISALPTLYFVDKDGNVSDLHVGAIETGDLMQQISKLY